MKFYLQSILIVASFILVFVWNTSQLSDYTIPLVGFLIFIFLIVSMKNKRNLNLGGPANFFLLNSVLLLFIFSTGGISSTLFFILYFLLFAAAFIMDPRTVFIFPIGIVIIFYTQIFKNDVTENLIKVVSLFLLSPLAYFFGMQFAKNDQKQDEVLETKERATEAANDIAKDVSEVVESAKDKLEPDEVQKLNDILEETDDLRSETK